MSRFLSILLCLMTSLLLLSGCGPSAQERYDGAVTKLDQAQSTLDSLLPSYVAARHTAENAVCREIAGTTPEESASAALQGLGDVLNPTTVDPAANGTADGKKGNDGKKAATGRKGDELDKTIDNLIAAEKNVQEKSAAIAAPAAKANEVMNKIKTPGTPEAKRLEEKSNQSKQLFDDGFTFPGIIAVEECLYFFGAGNHPD